MSVLVSMVNVFRAEPRLRTRATDLAIMSSSSVRMTRTLTRPASGEISGAFFALRFWSEFDAEKAESVADPLPDERRVFADAGGEDERVQSAQRRGEGADPFFRLVAKQLDGFRRANVVGSRASKSRTSELVSGNAEQPGFVVHHVLKLRRASCARCAPGSRPVRDPGLPCGCSSPILPWA